jgi:hypothetical protein
LSWCGLSVRATKAALTGLGRAFVALIEAAQIKGMHRQIASLLAGDADFLPLQLAVLRAGSGRQDGLHALARQRCMMRPAHTDAASGHARAGSQ